GKGFDAFLSLFKHNNISILDYSEITYTNDYVIPYDQHPNVRLNEEISDLIEEDLGTC
ncbi:MAG: hypothetical protein HGA85_02585, partial [Nanoarchaeota archaeon]|nr:hypothetical protein [Nanoarchaeota archaeon]